MTTEPEKYSLEKLRQMAKMVSRGEIDATKPDRARLKDDLTQAYASESGGTLSGLQLLIGQWRKAQGFETHWKNVPEKLMLTVTELSEAMEAYRHLTPAFINHVANQRIEGAMIDWEDPNQFLILDNFGEELADVIIRMFDLADAMGVDLQSEVCQKMAVNELRPYKHGKEC